MDLMFSNDVNMEGWSEPPAKKRKFEDMEETSFLQLTSLQSMPSPSFIRVPETEWEASPYSLAFKPSQALPSSDEYNTETLETLANKASNNYRKYEFESYNLPPFEEELERMLASKSDLPFTCRHDNCDKQYTHRQSRNRHEKRGHIHKCNFGCLGCSVVKEVEDGSFITFHSFDTQKLSNNETSSMYLSRSSSRSSSPESVGSPINEYAYSSGSSPESVESPINDYDFDVSLTQDETSTDAIDGEVEEIIPVSQEGLKRLLMKASREDGARRRLIITIAITVVDKLLRGEFVWLKDAFELYQQERKKLLGRGGVIKSSYLSRELKSLIDIEVQYWHNPKNGSLILPRGAKVPDNFTDLILLSGSSPLRDPSVVVSEFDVTLKRSENFNKKQ